MQQYKTEYVHYAITLISGMNFIIYLHVPFSKMKEIVTYHIIFLNYLTLKKKHVFLEGLQYFFRSMIFFKSSGRYYVVVVLLLFFLFLFFYFFIFNVIVYPPSCHK